MSLWVINSEFWLGCTYIELSTAAQSSLFTERNSKTIIYPILKSELIILIFR
jgi:hypothetical protein